MEFSHTPVMGREVIEYLAPVAGGLYVDATLGGGGHTLEILENSGPDGRVIGMDRDGDAIEAAGVRLAGYAGRVTLVRDDFRNVREVLKGLGISCVDGVVADLGVSAHQLLTPDRGFSFSHDAPLDMRMDQSGGVTAADLVATLDERELAGIFRRYGEERFARRIAGAIVRQRKLHPVETTGQLAAIILDAVPARFRSGRIHPATRVFQALRIAVNDELAGLTEGLRGFVDVLAEGARMVIISFHSLEDRVVKETLREFARGCTCPREVPRCVCGKTPALKILTRRVVRPSEAEVASNPRSRSARLRAAEKL
ncbi:MAG: 16S rRNA (cytosine(1402)-N(4))-methyltransferase RsmH [Thermodesulfobacteriota bacterium]